MDGLEMHVSVVVEGPLFDARGPEAVAAWTDDAGRALAEEGERRLQSELRKVLRNPTPVYQTRIKVTRSGDLWRLHDDRMIYGPWLEGTGSRNYPETRFRGYRHWRKVRFQMRADAARLVRARLPELLRRLR